VSSDVLSTLGLTSAVRKVPPFRLQHIKRLSLDVMVEKEQILECRCIQWLKHTSKAYLLLMSHQIEQPYRGNENSHDLLLTLFFMLLSFYSSCLALGIKFGDLGLKLNSLVSTEKSDGDV